MAEDTTSLRLEDIEKPDEVRQAEADPNNAGNPAAVRKKAKVVEDLQRQRQAVVGALLEQKAGREFLAFLMFDVCHLFKSTAKAGMSERESGIFEGARHVGLTLDMVCLRADATRYMLMRKEFEGLE